MKKRQVCPLCGKDFMTYYDYYNMPKNRVPCCPECKEERKRETGRRTYAREKEKRIKKNSQTPWWVR